MVSEQDAALPLAGRICITVGKPEVETFHSSLFVSFLLYSMWFGKAAEVFTLCQEALGFVGWPRGSRRPECSESQAPVPQSQRLCDLNH